MTKKTCTFSVCFLLILSALFGCGPSLPKPRPISEETLTLDFAPEPEQQKPVVAEVSIPAIRAPWEVWEDDALGSESLRVADALVRAGKLEESVAAYQQIESNPESLIIGRAAYTRRLSSMLKLGRSREVLQDLSTRLRRENREISDLSPELSLLTAFAYKHRYDHGQLFAWLSLANRQAGGRGVLAEVASELAKEILQSLQQSQFDTAVERWKSDTFLNPFLVAERLRRAQGGQPNIAANERNWFSAQTYQPTATPPSQFAVPQQGESAPPAGVAASAAGYSLGVLLPLTGEYAEHAARVKRGIELALAGLPTDARPQVFYEDTQGDPFLAAEGYQRLVDQHRVSLIIGPLLSRTTESVALQSSKVGVPFISFTKKPGIPQLGNEVFRLGATNEGQAADLVAYAMNHLNSRSFAVIYPNNDSGREFAEAFTGEVAKLGGRVSGSAAFNREDELSLHGAVVAVDASGADAVFIPETIENAYPLIKLLKEPSVDAEGEVVREPRNIVLLGPAYWDDQVAIRGFGALLDGAIFATPLNIFSQDPVVVDFVRRFQMTYDTEPDILAAQSYDAVRLGLKAIQDGGGSKTQLHNALRAIQGFPGVTGKLSVSADGEIIRRMNIMRLEGGDAVQVAQLLIRHFIDHYFV